MSAVSEEVEHAAGQQGSCIRVVGRDARVGEVVLVTWVEEQLRMLGRLDERASSIEVALVEEDRVGVHRVDRSGGRLSMGRWPACAATAW